MKTLFLFAVLLLAIMNATAQSQTQEENPDEQIIVNKEFDENGNLIAYDSTYIHSWSSDSTLVFPFDNHSFFEDFPNMEEFLGDFFSDSLRKNQLDPHGFFHSPFGDKDFFSGFEHMLKDSSFFSLPNDSVKSIQPNFVFPDLKILEEQMNEAFRKQDHRNFQNEDQRKEWEELMKKHRKELNEFQKKWEKSNED